MSGATSDGPGRGSDDPFGFDPDERDESSRPEVGSQPEVASESDVASQSDVGSRPDATARAATPSPEPEPERTAGGLDVRDLGGAVTRRIDTIGVRWLGGVLAAFVLLVVLIVALGGPDRPVGDLRVGERLPVFAAPLATRPRLDFDAVNLAERDDQGDAGRKAACSIRDPSVLTSCSVVGARPLALVLWDAREPRCSRGVDQLERLRRQTPGYAFLAVAGRGEHDETAATVRARRWALPVVYDRDGAFSRRLGDPGCAALFVVGRDGRVRGRLDGLRADVDVARLLRSSAAGRAR